MKLDLHIHSKYSFDSLCEPKKIIRIAEKKNLGGIAITDHNTIRGGMNAATIPSNVIVIVGCEFSTDKGDIIGLFLNEEINTKYSCIEVIEAIKEQGGVSILAHPFKREETSDVTEIFKKIDAVEGFNARTNSEANLKATNMGLEYGLSIVGGSDAHFYFEIGRGVTVIESSSYDAEDIRKAILKGKTKALGVHTPQFFEYCSKIIKISKTRRIPKLRKIKNKLTGVISR